MKKIICLLLCSWVLASCGYAQKEKVTQEVLESEIGAHIRFLAADEMRGRDTGSPELEIAARYIAEAFRSYGLKPVKGADDFFQPVKLINEEPPAKASFSYQSRELKLGEDMLILSGDSMEVKAPIVYANYALPEDLAKVDVKGKIVIAKAGTPEASGARRSFFSSQDKKVDVAKLGGLALVELYHSEQLPWTFLVKYINKEQLSLYEEEKDKADIPLIWLNDPQDERLSELQDAQNEMGTLSIMKKKNQEIQAKNVVAMVEGTDPKLKKQYVVLSAHYDHVGVGEPIGIQDSIYNGARDNAVGTAALLGSAKYFSKNPPKRSVLFLALTAEEKGMLGSAWYAAHPLLPLEKMVFNLNTDGAGYNDTTKVTVIGLERTTAEEALVDASGAFGLTAITDPVPEQNLYDRSDNVNFAHKGIPAVDFSPGFTAFDQEIMQYYHQVADEVESLDFAYVEKFAEAFTLAAEKIADMPERPFWKPGDKYENAGKDLYGK